MEHLLPVNVEKKITPAKLKASHFCALFCIEKIYACVERKLCLSASPSFSLMPYTTLLLLALKETGAAWKCVSVLFPSGLLLWLTSSFSYLYMWQNGCMYNSALMKTTLNFLLLLNAFSLSRYLSLYLACFLSFL